jgi:hypothetical protein
MRMDIRDNSERARQAIQIGYLYIAVHVITTIPTIISAILFPHILDENNVAEPTPIEALLLLVIACGAILLFGVFVYGSIVFLKWFRRAFHNIKEAGAQDIQHQDDGSGWAIAVWFVPFYNLVAPYRVMKDIWLWTHRFAYQRLDDYEEPSVNLLRYWWVLLLVAASMTRFADKALETAPGDPSNIGLLVISNILYIVSIYLTIVIVRKVAGWEESMRLNHHEFGRAVQETEDGEN